MLLYLYHGEGDHHISTAAFEQLSKDSDRAAGVVAGSVLEQRLREYLISTFPKTPKTNQCLKLFNPSGAFGSFSVKIDMACLFKLVNERSHHDLKIMKDIRNRFAHHVEIDSFDHSEVSDRCRSLQSIDTWLRAPSPRELTELEAFGDAVRRGEHPPMPKFLSAKECIIPDGAEMLKQPRFRYVQSAMIFSFVFGMKATGYDLPSWGV
jgi:hypothetical protein